MTCDHKLTNHNVNQFQPITAVHSQITTCEVKGYVTTVGDKLSVLAGFIANLTLTDSVNIDLCGWYSSNITCLFLLVQASLCLLRAVTNGLWSVQMVYDVPSSICRKWRIAACTARSYRSNVLYLR